MIKAHKDASEDNQDSMNNQSPSREFAYQNWREGFLRTTLIVASLLGLLVLFPALFANSLIYSALYVIIYISLLLVTILPAPYTLRSVIFITLMYGLAVSGLPISGITGDARVFMVGAIIMTSLLLSWRSGVIMTIVAMLTYLVFGWLALTGAIAAPANGMSLENLVSSIIGVLLLAILIVNGVRLTQTEYEKSESVSRSLLNELQGERETLEKRVEERTRSLDKRTNQLQAVADVGKSITTYRNLSELLQQSVYLIYENFGYYHAGIFLLDDRMEYAILTAANSEGGRRMLEKGHQLKVGETGIVGFVAESMKARIALDVGDDAVYFNNPDLPETRSEMALPLVASGRILGVLDVQSTEPQAFTEDDVATLQILAEQIAVAIQNANLFSETEKALETARLAYGELSREAWSRILRNQSRVGFIATPPATIQTDTMALDSNLIRAIESGDVIHSTDGLSINVPIRVRGQVIGAIRLKKAEIAEAWTQDEANLIIALSDQLSGALESARLYQESQKRAARESLVSDISARLSAVSQMESILRETVQELGETIGNASVTFQLLDQPNGRDLFGDSNEGGQA